MSFKLSGSHTSSRNTSNTTSNSTTTPVLPDWISGLTQNVAGRVGGLLDVDPRTLAAPAHGLQTAAAARAGNLSGSPWNFDAAADLTRGAGNTAWLDGYTAMGAPTASAGRASDYVGGYLNPYLHDVVDSTSADLDANDGRVRAQQALDLAGSGAFGGSGAALTQSMTEGELSRARASSLGGLRSQAYTTALGAAAGDADRTTQAGIANAQTALQDRANKVNWSFTGQQQQLDAARGLGDLSSAYDANQRANIETEADLGRVMRGIDQEQRQAPFTSTQQIVAMLNGLPTELFRGEQKTGTEHNVSKGRQTTVGAERIWPK